MLAVNKGSSLPSRSIWLNVTVVNDYFSADFAACEEPKCQGRLKTILHASRFGPFNWIQLKSAIFVARSPERDTRIIFRDFSIVLKRAYRKRRINNAIRLLRGNFSHCAASSRKMERARQKNQMLCDARFPGIANNIVYSCNLKITKRYLNESST